VLTVVDMVPIPQLYRAVAYVEIYYLLCNEDFWQWCIINQDLFLNYRSDSMYMREIEKVRAVNYFLYCIKGAHEQL
jgi:hypothetical protein